MSKKVTYYLNNNKKIIKLLLILGYCLRGLDL